MQNVLCQAQVFRDDRQFNADKSNVIMTLMRLHATRQILCLRNKM